MRQRVKEPLRNDFEVQYNKLMRWLYKNYPYVIAEFEQEHETEEGVMVTG